MNIYGSTISLLERGLDFSSTKGKAIAQNIANVDTPNYQAKHVEFREAFNRAKEQSLGAYRTDARHFDFKNKPVNQSIQGSLPWKYQQDGNGVDMDKEQADLAANQIYYNALVERLNGKFNSMQSVIKGGR